MIIFEWVIVLLLGSVVLTALARRIGAPYPSLLAIGGAALALVPGTPRLMLEPELALALFVAPVLLDAAYDTSPRDLRANWLPVAGLVLVAVGATTVAVALVAHALVPSMPWAAAVALGAIVAPPDAAAATAVLRQIRLPHRMLTILEGESLLNDASALLIYRVAVAAAMSGTFSLTELAPTFLLGVLGSLAAGPPLALLHLKLTDGIEDAPSSIILQFVGTFGVWIAAEQIGLSGILTIVAYAITLARYAPERTPARLRVPAYAVWETTVFVLNVLAFVLIGLQLRPILERIASEERTGYLAFAIAVLATMILVRFAWVTTYVAVARAGRRLSGAAGAASAASFREAVVVSWCGMRGVVSLAAAYALPDGGPQGGFPYRDLILVTAFCVVVGTLVVQGMTLRLLVRRLDLQDDGSVAREVSRAHVQALRAALTSLDGDTSPSADALRLEYSEALSRLSAKPGSDGAAWTLRDAPARRRAVEAARRAVLDLRSAGEIGDDAFHRLEEELDRAELSIARQPD